MAGTQRGADDSGGPGLLSAAERLVAGTAVLGAALYVLVNALYIEFYDNFGVRPEQVGFDRLAVLARSAWVALVGVALLGPIAIASLRGHFRRQEGRLRSALGHRRSDVDSSAAADEQIEAFLDSMRSRRRLAWMVVTSSVVLLAGFLFMLRLVNIEAARVADGHSSNGIGFPVSIVDIRAIRAEVTWVDGDKTAPRGLSSSEHLMYLGSGNGVTVLLACGSTTYVVQNSAVVVALLDQGSTRGHDDVERQRFQRACS